MVTFNNYRNDVSHNSCGRLTASEAVTSDATALRAVSLYKIPCGPHVVPARRRRHRRIRAALARPGIPRFVGNGWGGRALESWEDRHSRGIDRMRE